MKRIALIVAMTIGAVAIAAPPKIRPITERKFDHDRHANAANKSGKSAECKDCHRQDANGVTLPGKEHTRCAACHTYPSSCSTLKASGPKGPARVCEVCHIAKRRECLPDDLPPPPTEKSFGAKFTHAKHLALGSSIEKDCVQCHPQNAPAGAPKMQAHKSCGGCHNANGAKPAMTECFSCHVPPSAIKKSSIPPDPYRLVGFDHRAHHSASNKTATCVGCHEKVVGDIPRPTMAGCQSKCHDGQKAFSTVGTKCSSCHRGSEPATATKPDSQFLHAAHANRNVKINDCGQCHGVEADGRLTPPLAKKDHMPCALSGCHQTEFMSRATKICSICHDAVAPWQKNTSRSKPPAKPEWYETIDHATHLAKIGTGNNACSSCHGEKLTGGPRPGGHDGCVGCHGKVAKPAMGDCGGCHLKDAPQRAALSQWSVRAQFEKVGGHAKHATDKRTGKQSDCLGCHPGVRTAKTLAQIKPSTMGECDAACHNGKVAFKTTGFECSKCHSAPRGTPTAMVTP